MGLLDIDPFMETAEGRAFFPYHRFAPGYRLAPDDEPSLKSFLRRLQWLSWSLIAGFCVAQPWLRGHVFPAFLIFITISMGLWFAAVWRRCRGLARTTRPMPPLDGTRRAAATLSSGFIVFGLVSCALAFAGGAYMLVGGIGERAMDVTCILIFGLLFLVYCSIALHKWTRRR